MFKRVSDSRKHFAVLCHFEELARAFGNHGFPISSERLIQGCRDAGDIQQDSTLFTQKALDRGIGINYRLNVHDHGDSEGVYARSFLNYRGVLEVIDRYNLSDGWRDAVLDELSEEDVPLSVELVKDLLHGCHSDNETIWEDMGWTEYVLNFLISEVKSLEYILECRKEREQLKGTKTVRDFLLDNAEDDEE